MLKDIELINFTDLNREEKKMVLLWRNTPNIKKWMFTSDDISMNNHFNFIESLNNQEEKLYFLVKNSNEYIGVINFTDITSDSSEIGIYSNPSLRGVGNILLQSIMSYAFNNLKVQKLIAEVFSQNEKALNLYKKYGFLEVKRRVFDNKELICMELKNENR